MLSFESDYIMGAHPEVLRRLAETNLEPLPGYGNDIYTKRAADKIREACKRPDADVFFITGGTQTNSVVISTMLRDWEGVISATTGHVSAHEAGAIEYTGHKILALPQHNGKLCADEGRDYIETFYNDASHDHMVFPGMVYISHPTEYGTLYTKAELTALAEVCRHYDIPLFLDGARLGYGLMSYDTDLTLPEIAELCDVFYIGGTKVGALCSEAVVFTHNNAPKHFFTMVKQHGALLAKGRLNSVQFDALFTDDLYFKISRHAIDMAQQLKDMFRKKVYEFFMDSSTNQQFIILENSKMRELEPKVRFRFWEKYDDTHTVVRFATAWSTTQEQMDELKAII